MTIGEKIDRYPKANQDQGHQWGHHLGHDHAIIDEIEVNQGQVQGPQWDGRGGPDHQGEDFDGLCQVLLLQCLLLLKRKSVQDHAIIKRKIAWDLNQDQFRDPLSENPKRDEFTL